MLLIASITKYFEKVLHYKDSVLKYARFFFTVGFNAFPDYPGFRLCSELCRSQVARGHAVPVVFASFFFLFQPTGGYTCTSDRRWV